MQKLLEKIKKEIEKEQELLEKVYEKRNNVASPEGEAMATDLEHEIKERKGKIIGYNEVVKMITEMD